MNFLLEALPGVGLEVEHQGGGGAAQEQAQGHGGMRQIHPLQGENTDLFVTLINSQLETTAHRCNIELPVSSWHPSCTP